MPCVTLMQLLVCKMENFVVWYTLCLSWFVAIMVCGRHGIGPTQFRSVSNLIANIPETIQEIVEQKMVL